jgi:hypothetical protein
MKQIVEYKTQEGTSIFAEVDLPEAAIGQVNAADDVIKASKSFDEALDDIMPAAQKVVNKLRGLSPHGIEVEFGIKLSGKLGAVFASAEAEANFTVTVSWSHESDGKGSGS